LSWVISPVSTSKQSAILIDGRRQETPIGNETVPKITQKLLLLRKSFYEKLLSKVGTKHAITVFDCCL